MDEKLFESIVIEAIELTRKEDFGKYKTAKFKKKMGIVHGKDYLKGVKIGYTVGMARAVCSEKKFNELHILVKNYINKTDKILGI